MSGQENHQACLRCGLCYKVCPLTCIGSGFRFTPQLFGVEIRRHGKRLIERMNNAPFLCLLCMHCRIVCPADIDLPRAIRSLKASLNTLVC